MQHQEPQTLRFQGENGRDEFRREQVAANVIQLLKSPIDVSPLVIDGDWRMGKTEFCHKLMNKFRDEDTSSTYHLLYVDAFQGDHADNPLLTILAGVLSFLPDDTAKEFWRGKVIPVLRFAATTVGKAGVAYLFKQNFEVGGEEWKKVVEEGG